MMERWESREIDLFCPWIEQEQVKLLSFKPILQISYDWQILTPNIVKMALTEPAKDSTREESAFDEISCKFSYFPERFSLPLILKCFWHANRLPIIMGPATFQVIQLERRSSERLFSSPIKCPILLFFPTCSQGSRRQMGALIDFAIVFPDASLFHSHAIFFLISDRL
jgi:hypothetical protein